MKKILYVLLGNLLVCGCAGTPPAWWTPTGKYPAPQVRVQDETPTRLPEQKSAPVEPQSLALPDEAYEEMMLTPLQDEERENETGESSSQTVVPPADDTLPPPSMLE